MILLLSEKEATVKFQRIATIKNAASSMIAQRQHYRQKSLSIIPFHNLQCFSPKLLFIFHDTLLIKKVTTAGKRLKNMRFRSLFASIFVCSPPLFMPFDVLAFSFSGNLRAGTWGQAEEKVHFIVINEKLWLCRRPAWDKLKWQICWNIHCNILFVPLPT